MNKRQLIQEIIAGLNFELEGYARSARAAHEEATDEQSKAENKYDTRGLEASYLARGQSLQAAEVMNSIRQYESFEPPEFGPKDAIAQGALVELTSPEESVTYFLGPCAGGTEITCEGKQVIVLTVHSPLGKLLVGKRQGTRLPPADKRAGAQKITRVE